MSEASVQHIRSESSAVVDALCEEQGGLWGMRRGGGRWRRWGVFVVGLVLVVAAVTQVVGDERLREQLADVLVRDHVALVGLLMLSVGSWLLTSATFAVLTNRYGAVGYGEMSALIGVSWLLNVLPMRPGFFGRLVYHKKMHSIRVRDSLVILMQAVMCTVCAVILFSCGALGEQYFGVRGVWWGNLLIWLVVMPVCVLVAIWAMVGLLCADGVWKGFARLRGGAGLIVDGRIVWAIGLRYLDLMTWVGRYWLAFKLMGEPITLGDAVLVAVVSQAAMMLPVQLGLREWIVGVFASLYLMARAHGGVVDGDGSGGQGGLLAVGLASDIVIRSAELLCAVPIGVASSVYLGWRWRMKKTSEARQRVA